MTTVATYTEARAHLSSLLDRMLNDRGQVVIRAWRSAYCASSRQPVVTR